jgi:hypothetical protein
MEAPEQCHDRSDSEVFMFAILWRFIRFNSVMQMQWKHKLVWQGL